MNKVALRAFSGAGILLTVTYFCSLAIGQSGDSSGPESEGQILRQRMKCLEK